MAHQFIQVESVRGVARITFNRPEVLNSFHTPMAAEVQAALDDAAASDARAVLLTGAGRAFCAGQDLAEAAPRDGPPLEDFAAHVRKVYNPIVRRIRNLEKPVVAAVNGVAAGAGANLAFACDFVLASESASFIQAFARIGLVPDTGGTYFLPRLAGLARATRLTMLGDRLTAHEAVEWGLIYRVCSPEVLLDEASRFAEDLATRATRALGLTKRLLNESLANDLDTQLEREAALQGEAGRTADYAEGVTAFRERREPEFEGR